MNKVLAFISNNSTILLGILAGIIIGFVYWFYFACYWGTYPLSAECWVNCSYGALIGGFALSLIDNKEI